MAYTRQELYRFGHFPDGITPHLPTSVYSTIKELGVARFLPTKRGVRAGCHIPRPIKVVCTPVREQYQNLDHVGQYGVNKSNLIYINCIDDSQHEAIINNNSTDTENFLKIAVVNTRSVRSKADKFLHHCYNNNYDLCAVTETWLMDSDDSVLASLTSDHYCFHAVNRQDRRGGGVGLLATKALTTTLLDTYKAYSFESANILVKGKTFAFVMGIVYRPPRSAINQSTFSTFMDEFSGYVNHVLNLNKNVIITGDFNIKVNDKDDADAQLFLDFLNSSDLVQHVHFSTHKTETSENTLDLVITTADMDFEIDQVSDSWFISDHCFVEFLLKLDKPKHERKEIVYRKIKNIDHKSFSNDLSKIVNDLEQFENISLLAQEYDKNLADCLEKHAPLKRKFITVRKKLPWFNDELLNIKRKKRKAEKKWRIEKTTDSWNEYKLLSAHLHSKIASAKWNYLNGEITKNANKPKELYKTMFQMLGKKKENPMPEAINSAELAGKFADYFYDKIENIRNELETHSVYETNENTDYVLECFVEVTVEDVRKIMANMKASYCGSDPCPTSLVKEHSDTLLPLITKLVNLSLISGKFPDLWKNAIVTPLIKKIGMKIELKSYRPVNNLPFISKVAEKCMLAQLNEYIEEHSFLPDYLSAYRAGYSTETVLLRMHNDILMAMENQQCIALAALDLSAAFDTVDHQVLLHILEKRMGITGQALQWLDTYLRPRSFQVKVEDAVSMKKDLPFSVPQGSCAGPVLYNIYVSSLQHEIQEFKMGLLGYADDQLVYKDFKAGVIREENDVVTELQQCLQEVNEWMTKNRLRMNPDKTEFIIFGSSQQLKKCKTQELTVCNKQVKKTSHIKFVGAYLDEELNMKKHIAEITRKCNNTLHNIRRIRKFLTTEAMTQLVMSLVVSRLDYANSLFLGLPEKSLKPLKNTQNFAAKLLTNRSKYDSNTEALMELHWLPVKYRVEYKALVMVYRCLHGDAPDYLSSLLKLKHSPIATRSASNYDLITPNIKRNTFASRAFAVKGPELWNKLPMSLRQCDSVQKFKKDLKTHLFRIAFNIF